MGNVLGGRDSVKVAVVQASPVFMNKQGCLEKACKKIEEAGKEGAELIVFPEAWIPAYPYWTMGWNSDITEWAEVVVQLQDNSLVIGSDDTEVLGEAAKKANAYLVMGCNELDDREGSRTLYNTLVFIGKDGKLIGRHRKLIPTFLERTFWGRGDASDIKVFETDIGRIGGQICWEHHIINVNAAFIAQGQDIHIAVWPGHWNAGTKKGETFSYAGRDINRCDLISATREYAFQAQCFLLSANGILRMSEIPDNFPFKDKMTFTGPGQEDFVGWACGGSHIVAPTSEYLVEPTFGVETILYATLEANSIKTSKAMFDPLGHYTRWDLVRLDVKEEPYEPFMPKLRPPRILIPTEEKVKKMAEKYEVPEEKMRKLIEELMLNP